MPGKKTGAVIIIFSNIFSVVFGGSSWALQEGAQALMPAALEGANELTSQIAEDENFLKNILRDALQEKMLGQGKEAPEITPEEEAGELESRINDDEKYLKNILRDTLQERILGQKKPSDKLAARTAIQTGKADLSRVESGIIQDEQELRGLMSDTVQEMAMSERGYAGRKEEQPCLFARAAALTEKVKKEFSLARMRTSVVTGVTYESNIYRFPDNEISDLKPRANVSHSVRLPRGESYLEAAASHNSERLIHRATHYRYSDFRFTSFYRPSNIFNWELDYNRQITSDLNVVDTNFQGQTINNNRHKLLKRNLFTSIFTCMPGGRQNLMHATLQQENVSCRPVENINDSDLQERAVYRAIFDYERYINPITSVFLGMNFQFTDYKSWGQNDARDRDWFVGFRRDLSGLTKFVARYDLDALTRKSTPESAVRNEQTHNVRINLSQRISPFTDISPYYNFQRKDYADRYWRYFSHEVGFSFNHSFLNGLSATFNPNYRIELYPQSYANTVDNVSNKKAYYSIGSGLNYRLNDWWSLGAGYSLSMVRGPSLLDSKYADNSYNIELRGDF